MSTEETTTPEAPDDRTIHQRMVAIIAELPAIGKTQFNEQQKFHFRGHDDVLNALTPLLAKHGVVIVPNVIDRVTEQRTTQRGSVMFEVNLHIEYSFYGSAGDHIVGSAWGEGTDMGDKATMKAGTMAFKAMLNQAFAINTAEGAEHDTDKSTVEESVRQGQTTGTGGQQPKPAMATDEDVETFLGELAAAGFDREAWDRDTLTPHKLEWEGVRSDWLANARRDLQNAIAKKAEAESAGA